MKSLYEMFLSLFRRYWSLIHFGLSSCGCLVVDKGVFALVSMSTMESLGRSTSILVAGIVARAISGNINYWYNSVMVFKRPTTFRSFLSYWGLCAVNITLSILATQIIVSWHDVKGLYITLVSLAVDVGLFLFSYFVQRVFIFKRK